MLGTWSGWPSGIAPDMAQGLWFCAGGLLVICLALMSRAERAVTSPAVFLLALGAILSAIARRPSSADNAFLQAYFQLYVLLDGALYVVVGALIVYVAATRLRTPLVAWAVAFALAVGMTRHGLWPDGVPYVGLGSTSPQTAFLAALALPLCAAAWWPLAGIPLLALGHAVYASPSGATSSLLGLGVGCCYLAWRRRQPLWLLGPGALLVWRWASVWAKWPDRLWLWRETLTDIGRAPWLGHGTNVDFMRPMIHAPFGWAYRHQDALAAWRDYGLIAPLALGLLIWQLWRTPSWRWQRMAVLMAGVVMSLQTQAVFPRVMVLGCVVLGACLAGRELRWRASCSA